MTAVTKTEFSVQSGASGERLGWVDLDLESSPGWWAASVATYCPSRMVEHPKSNSTQPSRSPDAPDCRRFVHLCFNSAPQIDDVKKEDRLRPWNVDTISKDGFSKTLVNNPPPRPDTSKMTEDEKESYMKEFCK